VAWVASTENWFSPLSPRGVIAAGGFFDSPTDRYKCASAMHGKGRVATHHNLHSNCCEIDSDSAHSETYYLFAAHNRDKTNWIAGDATS
jgi:hypothetical protein